MRVLALAGYDSFVNTARLIAPYFENMGCSVEFALIKARRGKQMSGDQVDRVGLKDKADWVTVEDLCQNGKLASYDIVLCCLEGTSTRQLLHYISFLGEKRPLLISVYPGLILRKQYDGYSMRTASDLVWLNCEADKQAFEQMARAFGLSADAARVFGIAPLLQPVERSLASATGPVVFFEQAVIPRYYDERLYLAERLIKLANANPNFEFLVKARTSGTESALHRTWHPIDGLLRKCASADGSWPPNLKLTSESASLLLSRASHCLTVCSTVAAEAINIGVPTSIIGDFGAQEDYGLHYFFESGLITNFSDIQLPFQGTPADLWREKYIADPREHIERLVKEATLLAKRPRQAIRDQLKIAEMAPEFRQFLIDKNGVQYLLSRGYQRRQPNKEKNGTLLSRIKTTFGL